MELFPYQEKARDYLIERRCALLAFTMGLGKTFISLAAAEKLNLETLVVCPAFMKKTWEREIKKFNIRSIQVNTWSNIKGPKAQVLIVDESHYGANPEAARTKALLRVAQLTREQQGFVWLLSGTPAKNTAAELFCQFEAIGMSGYSYEAFAKEFSNEHLVRYGNMQKFQKKYKGVRNVEKLRALYAPFMWVLKSEQVLDLPMQIKKEVMCDFSVFSLDDLGEFKKDPESFAKNKNFSAKKLMQAGMNKSTTRALAEELSDSFEKVIIFSDHVEPTQWLASSLGCDFITGEVMIEKRDSIIETFKQRGKFLCCTIGAAGVGLNLQFANCMIFNDLPWVPGSLMQAEKRIHRIGQSQRCFYYYTLDPGLGEVIYGTLQKKIMDLEKIT